MSGAEEMLADGMSLLRASQVVLAAQALDPVVAGNMLSTFSVQSAHTCLRKRTVSCCLQAPETPRYHFAADVAVMPAMRHTQAR